MPAPSDIAGLTKIFQSQAYRAAGSVPLAAASTDRQERGDRPDFSVGQVLAWAHAFFERTGDWPDWESGPIEYAPGETWFTVSAALALGRRGLPRGRSLRDFLQEHRGRIEGAEAEFSIRQILDWAVDWQSRTGLRPRKNSGEIPDSGGMTWRSVDDALRKGRGILPGGSSLARLLATSRAVLRRPAVTERQILVWADAHYKLTNRWPGAGSGPIAEVPGENWRLLDRALAEGTRSLPGGSSLAELLIKMRGPEAQCYPKRRGPLAIPVILAWADAHRARTGRWPSLRSGLIPEGAGDTWRGLNCALRRGGRGLPGGSSLARMLKEHRRQCAGQEDLRSEPGRGQEESGDEHGQ
jgi:hypothetical protein